MVLGTKLLKVTVEVDNKVCHEVEVPVIRGVDVDNKEAVLVTCGVDVLRREV